MQLVQNRSSSRLSGCDWVNQLTPKWKGQTLLGNWAAPGYDELLGGNCKHLLSGTIASYPGWFIKHIFTWLTTNVALIVKVQHNDFDTKSYSILCPTSK